MLQYILECISFQLVFLIIYDFFLKKETFFQWNRLYLLGTHILSLILPWIKIEAFKTEVSTEYFVYPEFLWNLDTPPIVVANNDSSLIDISWQQGVFFLGLLGATLLFGYKMYQLYLLRKNGVVRYFPNFMRIIVANSHLAFSFFKSIFLGDKVLEKEHENIVKHELVHIRQKHSWDLLFFEVLRIVCWFNPLVYVYQSRISELHEFIADAQVAKTNKIEQYQLLLSQVFQTQNISFVNQFFKTSLIKKRIAMLQRTQSKKIWQLKYLLLVPMVLGMLAYTSSETQTNDIVEQEQISHDAALIAKVTAKIEKEVEELGSLKKVRLNYSNRFHSADSEGPILSKEDYFESVMLFNISMQKLSKEMSEKVGGRYKDFANRLPFPSTARYESYVRRKKVFNVLDNNLRFSISANYQYEVLDVEIIDKKRNYPNEFYVFSVENMSDLTGTEVRAFNNKLDEVFEKERGYNAIVITDDEYAIRVYEKVMEESSVNRTSSMFDSNNDETTTPQKSTQEKDSLKSKASENLRARYNELMTERKRLLKSSNERNPIIVNLDQHLLGLKNQMQANRNSSGLYASDLTEKYNQLILERKRLLKISNERNPIIINLDQQLQGLRNRIEMNQNPIIPFAVAEEVPVFPRCESDDDKRSCFQEMLQKHISKNFRYPEEAQKLGIQGRVSIMFTIDQDGSITNIRKRGPHKLLEAEAERIITLLPKMTPGRHEGKTVNIPFSIPITFKLKEKDFKTAKNTSLGDFDLLPSNIRGANLKLKKTVTRYNELVLERKRLLLKSNEKNPVIVNLDKQLWSMASQIYASGLYGSLPIPFAVVDKAPIFQGCDGEVDPRQCFQSKLQKHISKNFRYPEEAQELGVQGRVAVMFVMDKNGDITNVRAKGPHKLLEEEAKRIISLVPKVKPGVHKGKKANVPFSIPITFKLQKKSSDINIQNLNLKGLDPLFIVDGVEFSKKELSMVRPDNIESISVLKDDIDVNKYGLKGKNGVVQISTKKIEIKTMAISAQLKNEGKKYISGKVTDGSRGLPGVNISIEQANRAVVSNFDGEFTIEVAKGDVITFQFIGLPTAALKVTDQEKYLVSAWE